MTTTASAIKQRFDSEATEYDKLIVRIVPQYREQTQLIGKLVRQLAPNARSAADLACGQGDLAAQLLRTLDGCRVKAIDYSENMMAEARKNLQPWANRVDFALGDVLSDPIGSDFDIIVSGFLVHHFDGEAKRSAYQKCYDALKPGGTFLSRDLVAGPTLLATRIYEYLWAEHLARHGEDRAVWIEGHRDQDKPEPLQYQIDMLNDIGFRDVAAYFQFGPFAVFGGIKPEAWTR